MEPIEQVEAMIRDIGEHNVTVEFKADQNQETGNTVGLSIRLIEPHHGINLDSKQYISTTAMDSVDFCLLTEVILNMHRILKEKREELE